MKINNVKNAIWTLLIFCSCNNFLDEKPDVKMVIPKSLNDAELLLNDYNAMNAGYPLLGEWGTDQYYITNEIFDGGLNLDQRNVYTWNDDPISDIMQWQRPYKTVFNSNQVLQIVDLLGKDADFDKAKYISGIAHFYRAFAFEQLTEVFAPTYQKSTANVEMGIPLRLDPGIDKLSVRASLQQSFDQIINDYKSAANLLPLKESIKGRPFRASAYAGLARTYLYMGQFDQAYIYADSCLQTHRDLMDYNALNAAADLPIDRFNSEVLFAAISGSAGPMSLNFGLVDSTLYKSYSSYDLRKNIFFRKNTFPVDSYGFKGNYDKSIASVFVGLTTSEIYLIKAESAVRTGKINEAIAAINTLLKKRHDKNNHVPVTETNPDVLLSLILQERHKELVFRGRRWSDLKRLNLDPRFQKILKKIVHGTSYQLEPNNRKYAVRLPEPVVTIGNLPQNIR